MTDTPREDLDLLIIGAGPVGLTLARALADSGLRLAVIDRRTADAALADPRALALSHGARELLAPLGAWPERAATSIQTIHISQRGGFGRSLMDRADYGLPALGYVLRYRDLAAALRRVVPAACCLDQTTVTALEAEADGVAVDLATPAGPRHLRARLVVHAEGTPADDPAVQVRDYGQHAIIAEAEPDQPHACRAWERFTPDGPLALLPLDQGYALVFTVPAARADALMALDDAGFLAALNTQFGRRFAFRAVGRRDRYPLALRLRKELVGPRQVWIGNTAQTLHPVSGQGFNLGLRDAWQLAERLCRSGGDPGDAALLATYARQRQLDRQGGAVFTDGVVRLFSNDLPPLRRLRGLGLFALDLLPPARHFVARRMIYGARAWP
ncbi:MAG: hypothetical protein RIR00_1093 [Pseudomonadota bacterium]|jgi:2-octaprenyl-6-methoxyphenol hydroxylase